MNIKAKSGKNRVSLYIRDKEITKRQYEIIVLLLNYRFLTAKHIQLLLGHHSNRQVNRLLKPLKEKKYICWSYQTDMVNLPAIYSVSVLGKKQLNPSYLANPLALRHILQNHRISQQFKKRCLFIATISILFFQRYQSCLSFFPKATIEHMNSFPPLLPDAYVAIQQTETKRYFMYLFEKNIPQKALRSYIDTIITYADEQTWFHAYDASFPTVLYICPDQKTKTYITDYIKQYTDQQELDTTFFIKTTEQIEKDGLGI